MLSSFFQEEKYDGQLTLLRPCLTKEGKMEG